MTGPMGSVARKETPVRVEGGHEVVEPVPGGRSADPEPGVYMYHQGAGT